MASEGKEFERLNAVIKEQQKLIKLIADKLEQIESIGGGGGGGGSASIEDYQSNMNYKRNVLVVDTETETVYRVLDEYVSVTVEDDCAQGFLKLVGFESQIVNIGHNPTQAEINNIPDDALVTVYSSTDAPYIPSEQE